MQVTSEREGLWASVASGASRFHVIWSQSASRHLEPVGFTSSGASQLHVIWSQSASRHLEPVSFTSSGRLAGERARHPCYCLGHVCSVLMLLLDTAVSTTQPQTCFFVLSFTWTAPIRMTGWQKRNDVHILSLHCLCHRLCL